MNIEGAVLIGLVARAVGLDDSWTGVGNTLSLSEKEWERIFALACQHNVAGLVCDVVCHLPEPLQPPCDIRLKFGVMRERCVADYHYKQKVCVDLVLFYQQHDIRTLLLKGFPTASYYPLPALRSFSDLDIYLFGDYRKADALLEEKGIAIERDIHHHTTFEYQEVHVENHFDFIARYGHKSSSQYEQMLKEVMDMGTRQRHLRLAHSEVPVWLATPTFNALFLMRHLSSHFAADRVSVRHLLDWLLFLEKEGNEVDWQYVNLQYERFGMNRFVGIVMDILKRYFHYSCVFLEPQGSEEQSERVLNEILYGEFHEEQPRPGQVVRRLRFKWDRLCANKWKHDLCFDTPWLIDLGYAIRAKIMKPKTILH